MALWSKKPEHKVNAGAQKSAAGAPSEAAPAARSAPAASAADAAKKAGGNGGKAAADPGGEEQKRRNLLGLRLAAAFSSIVAAMMRSKAHRDLKVSDIERMVLPAVRTRQFSIAQGRQAGTGMNVPLGFVLWASVSPEVDRKLSSAPDKPFELPLAEWRSGPIVWIVDALGQPALVADMLKRLAASDWRGRTVKVRSRDKAGKVAIKVLGTGQPSGQ